VVTTSGGLEIRLFDQDSPGAAGLLRELHDEVLRPSFRPEEYASPAVIDPAKKLAIIARADDGVVVGGALGEVYPRSGVLLLGYLAVRPGLRGKGIGSVLMAALKERWLGQDNETLAVLEIDDPRYHAPHPDHGDPAARLRFYGAFGVRLLAIPYFQPRLRDYLPRGYHMLLGVIPAAGETLAPAIPARRVSAFLSEYFEDCEGAVHDDAEFRLLLDACRGPEIELVSPADLDRIPDGPDGPDGLDGPGRT
jgi:predicted N-acetyltransferase YhbS